MPYITEAKLNEAKTFVKNIDDACDLLTDEDMIYRLKSMTQYEAYSKMLKNKVSKKHNHNGIMCVRCGQVVVKLDEHQQTEKCRLAYERKEYVDDFEVVECYKTKNVVDTYNQKMLMKKLFREKIAKKISEGKSVISKTAKKEILKWTDKIMLKKLNGEELSKTLTLKQHRIIVRAEQKEKKFQKIEMEMAEKQREKKVVVKRKLKIVE